MLGWVVLRVASGGGIL